MNKVTLLRALGMFACFGIIAIFVIMDGSGAGNTSPEITLNCMGKKVIYGKGVYYFPCRQDEFGRTLSQFVTDSEFEGLEIVAITSDDTGGTGMTTGYFVVVRPKDKCEPPSKIVR